MIDDDKVYEGDNEREWIWDLAVDSGFEVNKEGEIFLPDGVEMDDALEDFGNIVANIAIKNYVDMMCKNLRGNNRLH